MIKDFDLSWKRYYLKKPGLKDGFCSPMSCRPPKVFRKWPNSMSQSAAQQYFGCSNSWIFPPKNAILTNNYLHSEENTMNNGFCVCGSGLKQENCHIDILKDSALMGLWQKYFALDNEIEKQKQMNNTKFVCHKGCADCCSDYFYISLLEFIGIKHHMLTLNKSLFLKACDNAAAYYHRLRVEYPDEFMRLESPPSLQSIINDHAVLIKFLPCPLLDRDKSCMAYKARPLICRLHGISSAFTACHLVDKKRSRRVFAPKPSSFLVNIEYSDELCWNVNKFQKKGGTVAIPRLAPLAYWLTNEQYYQGIYELAYLRSLKEFIENC